MFGLLKAAPWWFGPIVIGLMWAAFAFLFPALFGAASSDEPMGRTMSQAIGMFSKGAAPWVAFFITLIWIAALFGKLFDRARLDRQTGIESIRELSWQDFERLLAETFRRQGYVVEETPPRNDGGIDLLLHRRGERTLVQAKQWKTRRVGVKPVRELAGVVMAERAIEGIMVASGDYTVEAEKFARKSGIRLIDGNELEDMVQSVQRKPKRGQTAQTSTMPTQPIAAQAFAHQVPSAAVRQQPHAVQAAQHAPPVQQSQATAHPTSPQSSPSVPPPIPIAHAAPPAGQAAAPSSQQAYSAKAAPQQSQAAHCPACGSAMVQRVAKKGTYAGRPFWGCSRFPVCRGTRPV